MPQRPMQIATRSEGGVWHGKNEKCGEAAFLYLPQSVVVIPGDSARLAAEVGRREGRERPPPKPGGTCGLK